MSEQVRACILIIGNEILSGRTQDTNLNFLATELSKLGIIVGEARVIPDVEATIIETLNHARKNFDYVFTTGGIGPTHDDITSACVAKAFGKELTLNPEAHKMLQSHYKPEDLNDARLRMAHTPVDAILIENPISKAPGFQLENVFVLAGVPRIAQAMFDQLKSRLIGGEQQLSATLSTNLGEGVIAKELEQIQVRFNQVDIGSYPYFKDGQLGVSLVIRSTDQREIENSSLEIKEMIERLGGSIISLS